MSTSTEANTLTNNKCTFTPLAIPSLPINVRNELHTVYLRPLSFSFSIIRREQEVKCVILQWQHNNRQVPAFFYKNLLVNVLWCVTSWVNGQALSVPERGRLLPSSIQVSQWLMLCFRTSLFYCFDLTHGDLIFLLCLDCSLLLTCLHKRIFWSRLIALQIQFQVQLLSDKSNVTSEALIKFQSLLCQWLSHKLIYPKTSLIWSLHVDHKWIFVSFWATYFSCFINVICCWVGLS